MARSSEAADALLDQVWDVVEEGDFERARELIRDHLERNPRDHFANDILAMVEAEARVQGHVDAPAARPAAPLPFYCLNCGNDVDLVKERVLLNTRALTFLGYDALNSAATCYICATCGLVHWFVVGSPGGYQSLHPDRRRDTANEVGDEALGGCMVCGFDRGYNRRALLNTRGLTFLGLDFLNQYASALTCYRCGFLHWNFAPRGEWSLDHAVSPPPDPPLVGRAARERRHRCLACGTTETSSRRGLLNSRGLTFFGLDFLNLGAEVIECDDCRFASWYVHPVDG